MLTNVQMVFMLVINCAITQWVHTSAVVMMVTCWIRQKQVA